MIPASEALERLREGNRRFSSGASSQHTFLDVEQGVDVAKSQRPFAIVLACSDSRVPVELVFDGGVGDLFVIRVAGNVVAPSQLESVELAATWFGTRLVVVLGHGSCGAVHATLEEVQQGPGEPPSDPHSIVGRIRPALEDLIGSEPGLEGEDLVHRAVRANVAASAATLRGGSEVLARLISDGGLAVVGAQYCLDFVFVEFFDFVGGI